MPDNVKPCRVPLDVMRAFVEAVFPAEAERYACRNITLVVFPFSSSAETDWPDFGGYLGKIVSAAPPRLPVITEKEYRDRRFMDELMGLLVTAEELAEYQSGKRSAQGIDYFILREDAPDKPGPGK